MKIFKIVNRNLQTSINFPFLKRAEENKILPIITISREKSAGGLMIAEKLAKKLGKKWDYFDKDIVEKIAKESKTSPAKVEEIEEKPVSYFQEFLESLMADNIFTLNTYHKNLLKVLYEIGSRGNVIIVGRGANFIFDNALKVRIIADKEQRIKWLMKYEKMSESAAKKDVEEADKERNKFVANLYNKDVTDPKNYDLTIKTSLSLPVEDAVDIIARIAKKRFNL